MEQSNSTEPILYDSSTWLYNTHVKPNIIKKSETNLESSDTQPVQVVKTVSKMMEKLVIEDEKLANMVQDIADKLNQLKMAMKNSEKESL